MRTLGSDPSASDRTLGARRQWKWRRARHTVNIVAGYGSLGVLATFLTFVVLEQAGAVSFLWPRAAFIVGIIFAGAVATVGIVVDHFARRERRSNLGELVDHFEGCERQSHFGDPDERQSEPR